MSYPLIILGAGASYDYIHSEDSRANEGMRPPLTNELFAPRFELIIKKFSHLGGLPGTIQGDIRNGLSLEESMSRISRNVGKNPSRKVELAATEFYLQALFREVSDSFGGQSSNNYGALIQEINDNFGKAIIVSFNYDILLEQALGFRIKRDDLRSYVSGPIKLIKVHGSCEWVHPISDYFIGSDVPMGKTYETIMQYPEYINSVRRDQFRVKRNYSEPSRQPQQNLHYYPAIAIPEPGKAGFVCPKSHIDVLERELQDIDKILIIGWKAGDTHFLKFLGERIKDRKLPLSVVSPSDKALQNIANKFREFSVDVSQASQKDCFSNFIGSKECKTFFGTA